MSGRKSTLTGHSIYLVVVLTLWASLLAFGIVAMADPGVSGRITLMAAVSTALVVMAALPMAAVVHFTNNDVRSHPVTRGLLWFAVLIILSDVILYLLPDVYGGFDMDSFGEILYVGGCFSILVPTVLLGLRIESKHPRADINLPVAATVVFVIVAIGLLIATSAGQARMNGVPIAWAAVFVILEATIVLAMAWQCLRGIPRSLKYLFLVLGVYFFLETVGDAANLYALSGLRVSADSNYVSGLSDVCFGLADVALTVGLWLYSWKTINPFTLKAVNDSLADTRRMMDALIRQSPDAICVYTPEGGAVTANETFYRVSDLRPEDVVGKYDLFEGMRGLGMPEADVARLRGGEAVVVKDLYYAPRGLHLYVKAYPIHSEYGTVTGYISSMEDITERVQSEQTIRASLEEKSALLKEIHHRVKNNLQIISSLLNLQSGSITDPVSLGYFRESQYRVKSMALIHDRLYRSENLSRVNFTDYIRSLSMFLFQSYCIDPGRIRINVDAPPVYLDIDKAIACGLILNELMTNSLKYAFPGDRRGEITVRIAEAGGRCTLSFADDGVGFPAGFDYRNTTTLGMQLVMTLTGQLEGEIAMDNSKGSCFTITFPA